eukprot:g51940.t1
MLSGETSVGKYPIRAVEMMDTIVRRAEETFPPRKARDYLYRNHTLDGDNKNDCSIGLTDTTGLAVYNLCMELDAHGRRGKIIVLSDHDDAGYTPRQIAKYRPDWKILAVTSHGPTARVMNLLWGRVMNLLWMEICVIMFRGDESAMGRVEGDESAMGRVEGDESTMDGLLRVMNLLWGVLVVSPHGPHAQAAHILQDDDFTDVDKSCGLEQRKLDAIKLCISRGHLEKDETVICVSRSLLGYRVGTSITTLQVKDLLGPSST